MYILKKLTFNQINLYDSDEIYIEDLEPFFASLTPAQALESLKEELYSRKVLKLTKQPKKLIKDFKNAHSKTDQNQAENDEDSESFESSDEEFNVNTNPYAL